MQWPQCFWTRTTTSLWRTCSPKWWSMWSTLISVSLTTVLGRTPFLSPHLNIMRALFQTRHLVQLCFGKMPWNNPPRFRGENIASILFFQSVSSWKSLTDIHHPPSPSTRHCNAGAKFNIIWRIFNLCYEIELLNWWILKPENWVVFFFNKIYTPWLLSVSWSASGV